MEISIILYNFVTIFVQVLTWSIIIRTLLSWFSIGGGGIQPLFRLLLEITEPVLAPIRRVLPTAGMIDFSPLVALLLIQFIGSLLAGVVRNLNVG